MSTSSIKTENPPPDRHLKSASGPANRWHCTKCFRLLGKKHDDRIHLRMSHGHEYFATLPTTAVCRCGHLNELPKISAR
jgi:hypothetical protein